MLVVDGANTNVNDVALYPKSSQSGPPFLFIVDKLNPTCIEE